MGFFSDQCPNCLSSDVRRRLSAFEQLSFINNRACNKCQTTFRVEPTIFGFLFRVIIPFMLVLLLIGVFF